MWTSVFLPTDIADPQTGEPLYTWAKVRPQWYWALCRLRLFLSIVWRVYDTYPDGSNYRLSVATAWSVSEVAVGLTEPRR